MLNVTCWWCCCAKFETSQNLSQQLPTFLLFRDRWSVVQQCWIHFYSSSNILGAMHAHFTGFTKSSVLYPSHDARQVTRSLRCRQCGDKCTCMTQGAWRGEYDKENIMWSIILSPFFSYAVCSRHLFLLFLFSTPDKCTWNLVRSLLVYWIQRILCILYSDVFTYYSTRLGVKRACFIPLVTECYISCLCYMLCSVVKLKKAMHACRWKWNNWLLSILRPNEIPTCLEHGRTKRTKTE